MLDVRIYASRAGASVAVGDVKLVSMGHHVVESNAH